MRILILCNVPPGIVGGAEVQALNLARLWVSHGHDVLIAGPDNNPSLAPGVRIVRIPLLRGSRALRGLSYAWGALWLLWRRRHDYDVIYCRFLKEQTLTACLGNVLLRLRKPVVACPAAAGPKGDVAAIWGSLWRGPWLWVLQHGLLHINALSRRIDAEVRTLGLNASLSNIPNGVNVPIQVPSRERAKGPLRCVFLGRLAFQKGLDTLLQALDSLKRSGLDLRLEIVGAGPLRDQLEAQCVELDLTDSVSLPGPVMPDAVSDLFGRADVFVLASRYEGLPGSLLEAFAHGVPAVVTRVSGAEDVVDEDTGWLVPIDDAAALAEALRQAAEVGEEKRSEMGLRAWIKAREEFDMTVVARRYEKLFETLRELN